MVTNNHYRWDFIQLADDPKPTPATSPKVADGSTLYTSDDSKLYVWYKDQWYEKTSTGGGGGGDSYTKSETDQKIIDGFTKNYVTAGKKADTTLGERATAEGNNNESSGRYAHTEGANNIASGAASHAEGTQTTSSNTGSHSEGQGTQATGPQAHAEGYQTSASGSRSHAEGNATNATGRYSHAGGNHTIADYESQYVAGAYNNNKSANAFEIGNGTSDNARSNAFEVTKAGKAIAGASTTSSDSGKTLATKDYVDAQSGADVGALKEQVDELDLTVNGEQYDSTLCYFYVETTSANQALDLRTIYNDTNIKNETAGTCYVGYDGEEMTAIVSDASLQHTFAEAGIHEVRVSGITGLTSNLLFRNSTILKKAVIGNTLTTIDHWLLNGVTMNEVLFLATTAPTFTDLGTSDLSMNNVVTIRVPSQSLDSYRNSAMANSNKAKLASLNTGIVGEVSDINTEISTIKTDLSDTQNDLDVLTDRFNDYTVVHDKDKTYITLNLQSDFYLDCRLLYHPTTDVYNDIQSLDWGDGNVIADVPTAYAQDDDNLRHNYTAGIYTIVLTGMTKFMGLWVRGNASRIEKVELSSQIGKIQYFAMDGLSNLVINNPVPFKIYDMNDVEITTASSIGAVGSIEIPEGTYIDFYDNSRYDTTQRNAFVEPNDNILYKDKTVTVGANGDYATIGEAMRHLSVYYPTYKYGGVHAYIKILSGTTISEQILVDGADWSWMEIIYEDYSPSTLSYDNTAESIANGTIVFDTTENYNAVPVDATNFTGVTHDTRGDVCLFRAENGGKLPIIGCVFKLVTQPSDNKPVAGMVCNRGSEGVIKTLCGFIGFNDGVISNNESSITIREGITMNCARWGCHSRHNGEVSARSVIATGCATINSNESAALCSDRVADLDGREAYVSNSGVQIRCNNTSRMNCNGTHAIGDASNTVEISNTYVSTSNCAGMFIDGTVKLTNTFGSTLLVNANYTFDTTYTFNTLSNNGVIYA